MYSVNLRHRSISSSLSFYQEVYDYLYRMIVYPKNRPLRVGCSLIFVVIFLPWLFPNSTNLATNMWFYWMNQDKQHNESAIIGHKEEIKSVIHLPIFG